MSGLASTMQFCVAVQFNGQSGQEQQCLFLSLTSLVSYIGMITCRSSYQHWGLPGECFRTLGKCSTIPWVDPFPPFHVSFLSSCAEVSRIQLSLSAALDLTRSVFAWNLRFRITEVHKSVGWLSY
jgi:hypothetical protein